MAGGNNYHSKHEIQTRDLNTLQRFEVMTIDEIPQTVVTDRKKEKNVYFHDRPCSKQNCASKHNFSGELRTNNQLFCLMVLSD